jgi:hypothetical protein
MYGFLDESGAPGAATRPNDFLVISLVVFPDKDSVAKCSATVDRLRVRLNLPDDYEFHFSRNPNRVKNGFVTLLSSLGFDFIAIAIRKTDSYKFASADYLAQLLLDEIVVHNMRISILMDSNPILRARLKKHIKNRKLQDIHIKSAKSHTNNLLQLADYVVGICAKRAKHTPKSAELYRAIARNELSYSMVRDQTKKS